MAEQQGLLDGLNAMQVGARQTTKVTGIQEGTKEDFYGEEYWASIEEDAKAIAAQKATPAIEVTTENGASTVLTVPETKIVHPKSNLAAWKRTYGDYPKVGQEITTKIDENGYNRIVMEK